MQSDRWRQISRVYDQARARSGVERRAFLDEVCGDDAGLRQEVESLLAQEQNSDGFLTEFAVSESAEILGKVSDKTLWGLEAGVAFGGYRIERMIGQGGMGAVFLAYDTMLHRLVALKVLESPTADPTARTRLLHEARAAAALNHPNICTIYEVGEANGRAFIAMEFVDGPPLSDRLAAGNISLQQAVRYGIQAADALAHAHEHGVVHRDFKAANVMLATSDRVKVVDFGLARRVDTPSAKVTSLSSIVPFGVIAGTPYAMAPEQVRGAVADPRTDIWALGVLLYEMVAGAKPFDGPATPDLFSAILRDCPAPLASTVPSELRLLIERSLSKNPADRYERASDVRAGLERVQGELSARSAAGRSDAAVTNDATNPTTSAGIRRRHRRLVPAIVAATALLVLLSAVLWRGPRLSPVRNFAARDWMLVATFTNQTGDANLDATIRQALVYELEQSPHINIFPDARMQEVLGRMRLPAGTAITEAVGREMCAREGLKALLMGQLTRVDNRYVVESRVIDPASGGLLASFRREVETRVDLLSATQAIASALRANLGETLSSIQANSVPLARVTSASFEAVQQFTLGQQALLQGRSREALQFFLQAIERDPTFASAHHYAALTYSSLEDFEQVARHLTQAFALADQVGPRERHRLLGDYYSWMEQYDRAVTHYRVLVDLYPDNVGGLANLGLSYGNDLQYGLAVEALQRALKLEPGRSIRERLADQLFKSGQFDEAVRLARASFDESPDVSTRTTLATYELARGNVAEAHQLLIVETGTDRAGANARALAQADVLLSQGRYQDALHELGDPLTGGPDDGPGARDEWRRRFRVAEILLDTGQTARAGAVLRRLPNPAEAPDLWMLKGIAGTRAGNLTLARALVTLLEREAGVRKSRGGQARVLLLQAAIALKDGHAKDAVALSSRAVQTFGSSFALNVLAESHAAAGDAANALQSYRLLLTRAGERTLAEDGPAFFRLVLARYKMGRLLEQLGQVEEARAEYQEFLRRWADGDRDLPLLEDVRRRVGQGVYAVPSGRLPTPAAYNTDSVTPSTPRSPSMRESSNASEQKGASPSHVATRQNVWQKWPASTSTAR